MSKSNLTKLVNELLDGIEVFESDIDKVMELAIPGELNCLVKDGDYELFIEFDPIWFQNEYGCGSGRGVDEWVIGVIKRDDFILDNLYFSNDITPEIADKIYGTWR